MKFLANKKLVILVDQAVFSGTSFLLTLLVARVLDVESFGLYAGYVLGIYLAVSGIGAFVIQPFQVLLAKIEDFHTYTAFAFWLQLILTVIVLCLTCMVTKFISWSVPMALFLFAAGFMLQDFGRKILLALNKTKETFILDSLCSLFLLMALLVFSQSGQNELAVLLWYLSWAYVLGALCLIYFLRPLTTNRNAFLTYLPLHFKEGKWLFFTTLAQWWSGNIFVVASGIYLGAAALGALRLAQSLMGVLNIILQTFENYVLPQTALRMQENELLAVNYLGAISRKAAFLFIPVLIGAFLFAEKIMVIAGGQAYGAYAYVLQTMTLLYIIIFLNQPIRLMIRALLLNQHFFYGYVISLVFALFFGHFLLSNFGLHGAILGLIGSQILLLSYWSFMLFKKNIPLWKSFISF